ncbi:hypothetical protein L6452_04631 [Arctium lappa]|uniref:Uncharacterized protein n=1 Tax=Arctium lappa TaxID=4217 RepID=A0ACB9EES0_ARCLA|nr:hypothetical protein L6452_04631 [Arctium lappa]
MEDMEVVVMVMGAPNDMAEEGHIHTFSPLPSFFYAVSHIFVRDHVALSIDYQRKRYQDDERGPERNSEHESRRNNPDHDSRQQKKANKTTLAGRL